MHILAFMCFMCLSQCFLCLIVLSTPPTLKLICVLSCQNRLRVWVATVTQMTLSFPWSKWCLLKIQKYSDTSFDRQYQPRKQLKWMLKWVQLNSRLLRGREPLRRNCHKMLAFSAVIKDILFCLWGHLGKHFIHLNRTCELLWSEPMVVAAHVSPPPPHTLFLRVSCCAVLSQERRAQEDLFACLV